MRIDRVIIRMAVRRWLRDPSTELTAEDAVRKEAGILSTLTREEEAFLFRELEVIAKLI